MRGLYLGRVRRHKPCVPIVVVWVHVPVWDHFFCHEVAICAFGRHGATYDLAQRGVGRSGRESVMAIGRLCRNAVGPPEWDARPWVLWCG